MPKSKLVVILPAKPPVDKYIAYKRVMLDRLATHELLPRFCNVQYPDTAMIEGWRNEATDGAMPIMIDVSYGKVSHKYHGQFESASAQMQHRSEKHPVAAMAKLIELANENNKTGMLKSYRHATPLIVREAYHVQPGENGDWTVFYKMLDVVNSFFWHQGKADWASMSLSQPLRLLHERLQVTEGDYKPFTLQEYMRRLYRAGRGEQEIHEKVSWWLDQSDKIQTAHMAAGLKDYPTRFFQVGDKPAGIVHVNGYFENKAASYQLPGSGRVALLIARNKDGHVAILPSNHFKRLNLQSVMDCLRVKEPQCWYHEKRFSNGDMLLNGSVQYTGEPVTKLTDDELIAIVQKNARWTHAARR